MEQTKPAEEAGSHGTLEAFEQFLAEIEEYHGRLDGADTALRSQSDNPDGDSIQACLQSLLEANREYSKKRERVRAGLDAVRGESPEFGLMQEKVRAAVGCQDEQIRSTEHAIESFPRTGDLAAGCRVMIDETTKLMDANLLVRDAVKDAGIWSAQREQRPVELAALGRYDAVPGAETRAELEKALAVWLQGGERPIEKLSVAAIDVDECGKLNQRFGHGVGNEALHAIGQLLVAENQGQARLARFRGERFLLLFPDSDLRAATNTVERLRQILEATRFECKHGEIRLTVSCGVAEATANDTPDGMLARAEATLMEAKRYGRNRTFVHEGKYPTPVVPPNFSIEPRRMTL